MEKAIISEVRVAEIPLDQLNAQARHALMGNLGIQYTYADEDRVEATMPVDHRTRQPFGILHGGATLALAGNSCRTRFNDSLPAGRDCSRNAGQWKPHIFCT
ncbi:hotdog fold thioesterase [Bacteroides ovatus]|nr:hotdog fold thioesterase [Bacteroides ovatus]